MGYSKWDVENLTVLIIVISIIQRQILV